MLDNMNNDGKITMLAIHSEILAIAAVFKGITLNKSSASSMNCSSVLKHASSSGLGICREMWGTWDEMVSLSQFTVDLSAIITHHFTMDDC